MAALGAAVLLVKKLLPWAIAAAALTAVAGVFSDRISAVAWIATIFALLFCRVMATAAMARLGRTQARLLTGDPDMPP